MKTVVIAVLLALTTLTAQASPPADAPVVDVTRPRDLQSNESPVVYIPAGQPIPLKLSVAGGVARSEPVTLELRFDRPLWFYGPTSGEPLVSRDGKSWEEFSTLFSGSVSVGMDQAGVEVKLEMDDR